MEENVTRRKSIIEVFFIYFFYFKEENRKWRKGINEEIVEREKWPIFKAACHAHTVV